MDKAFISNEEHLKVDHQITKALAEMELDPKKTHLELKDVIILAKKIGFAISPSQATEALFFAKGDVEKFKSPFTDEDLRRFIKWFYDNKPVLRLNNKNYLKHSKRVNNHSVTVRPSINMINTSDLDEHEPRQSRLPAGLGPFSPNRTASKFGGGTPMNEVQMRSKIQVSKFVFFTHVGILLSVLLLILTR